MAAEGAGARAVLPMSMPMLTLMLMLLVGALLCGEAKRQCRSEAARWLGRVESMPL